MVFFEQGARPPEVACIAVKLKSFYWITSNFQSIKLIVASTLNIKSFYSITSNFQSIKLIVASTLNIEVV
jgi:hypothetical protein